MATLITLQDYKLDKGISKEDKDAQITAIIGQVSAIISTYIGRDFTSRVDAEVERVITVDYSTDRVYLDDYPIKSIEELNWSNQKTHGSSVHWPIPNGQYYADLSNGILHFSPCLQPYQSPLRIKYILDEAPTGNDTDADGVPLPLKRAAIDLTHYYMSSEYKDSMTLKGAAINNATGTGSKNTPDPSFPPHIQRILDMYK